MGNPKEKNMRDPYIDILKGIGILSVVTGHCGILFPWMKNPYQFQQFLYQYHLMIFFFTAGMLYKPERAKDTYSYIGRQIKGCVPLFIGYGVTYVLLHNLFVRGHLINGSYYSLNETLTHVSNVLLLLHVEQPLLGPLWFVPMFLLSKIIFSALFQWAENKRFCNVAHVAVVAVCGALGLYMNHEGMFLLYNMQTAMLSIPVIYLGYYYKKNADQLERMMNPLAGAMAVIALVWCVKKVGFIQLSENMIISPVLFYPVTVAGMVFCLSLGKIIKKIPYICQAVACCGRESFHIMALHFTAFKLFDWIFGIITGAGWDSITRFPMAMDKMGWLYASVGITLPLLIVKVWRRAWVFVRTKK